VETLIFAGVALLAAWGALIGTRRRALRRESEARARARARRLRVPLVSANLRGQQEVNSDIWQETLDAAARETSARGERAA
jgi:uncharacterized membrane protein